MPRKSRERSPSDYYHVMMRGVNREPIFVDGYDKLYFMKIVKEESRLAVAAYCIMDNHVHLVVRCNFADLPQAFRSLNTRFAMHYNVLKERVGHVFQNRYRSETIEDYPYMRGVIRYVHNNPAKAKLTPTAGGYQWSSYSEYHHGSNVVSESEMSFVLELFDNSIATFDGFHAGIDTVEYLDMHEEIEEWRLAAAAQIVSEHRSRNGRADVRGLVECLLKGGKLGHRQIAGLVGVNASFVHQVSLQSRARVILNGGS